MSYLEGLRALEPDDRPLYSDDWSPFAVIDGEISGARINGPLEGFYLTADGRNIDLDGINAPRYADHYNGGTWRVSNELQSGQLGGGRVMHESEFLIAENLADGIYCTVVVYTDDPEYADDPVAGWALVEWAEVAA